MNWKQFIFKQVFYFETGKAKVVGRVYGWWNEALIIFMFLKMFGMDLEYYQMGLICFVGMVIIYISGRWYINKNYHKFETSFYNQQNPEILEILKQIKRRTKNDKEDK